MVADLNNIKIKLGDFDSEEIEIRVNKPAVIGDAVDHYVRLANGKQAIAYCASISHSQNTAAAFNAAGITAKHIDGTTPKAEREQAVMDFREGKITVLTNVDLFGEGLDCPGVEVVILLRPTQSLTLYIQQSMRGMRPDKTNPFKTAIILDHVGNVFHHGLPDTPREWSLDGVIKRRQAGETAIGIRTCPHCYLCHSPAPVCPYCSYEYQMTARQLAEEAGELKEFDAEVARKEKLRKIISLNECKTIADLKEFAKANGYKPGWVWHRAKIKNIRS
jgi:superfamily II DNA or RNA helicase